MRKILAVSGGIDSVVMLHLFKDDEEPPIVAHFDHGIRGNSADDAAFVERLAKEYGLQSEVCHVNLGKSCSEATARAARYDFLKEIASKYQGIICVAHHADDIIESIAINILRGTGWRGLAPMNAVGIERPLKTWWKKDIYRYAAEHRLHFRQDQTNTEDTYLRNRVRECLMSATDEQKKTLLELYNKQSAILGESEAIISEIVFLESHGEDNTSCYPRSLAEYPDALEIIRYILKNNDISLTRPQLQKCLDAIRNYAPNKRLSLDRKHFLVVGKYKFYVI